MSTDTREARADAKAEKARQKAMRPWYRKKRFWLLAVVAVIIIAAVAGGGADDTKVSSDGADAKKASGVQTASANTKNPPTADVEVSKCEKGQFGPEVQVKIVNHSSKRSNYLISANLVDANGAKVGEANGASNNIDPGQSSTDDLFGTATGEFTKCQITNVERFAS
jgi:hypothetical protein